MMTQDEYVSLRGTFCPSCSSQRIIPEQPRFLGKNPDKIIVICNCFDCGSSWEEFYQLVDYKDKK